MPPADDFYVGYFRAPLRIVRFVTYVAIVLVLLTDGVALLLYRAQENRASGHWDESGEVAITGTMVARPYPVVQVAASAGRPAHAVLLVSEGKAGAPATAAALDGKQVTVRGYEILRDDLTVLQLDQDPALETGAPGAVATEELGPRTFIGEIVDAKCFLGAMVPGEGKVHKDCASLCILGGIPPLFVTRDGAGKVTYRLLADQDGGPIAEAAASRAGEFITLTGDLRRVGAIEVFRVRTAALE
ncbi:MAG TPA: hypothetical protein VLX09_04750 [Stellaceae bacterium]|nr:hypothetical protein [Stellaceae bacterium]